MSLEDPFFVVRDEVRQSLSNAQAVYSQWCLYLDSEVELEKLEATVQELRNCLKSIEWDLEDLEETIKIAEANPHKFRVNTGELQSRKSFISDTRGIVKKIKDSLGSEVTSSKMEALKRKSLMKSQEGRSRGQSRFSKLEGELERSNQGFIEGQREQQQMYLQQQDRQLDQVGASVSTLKRMGETIGDELEDQAVMLEEFDREMDSTESRLKSLTNRVNKAIRKSGDKCQIVCIVCLVIALVVVIGLFFIP